MVEWTRGRLKPETYHAFHVVVFGNIYLPKAHQCRRLLQTQTPAIGTRCFAHDCLMMMMVYLVVEVMFHWLKTIV